MTTKAINLPYCTHRYALFVSYLGTNYRGSQRLTKRGNDSPADTIQEAIECSLESFLPIKRSKTTSSSRTDKGVHAMTNCFSLPLMDDVKPTEKVKRLANEWLINNSHQILVKEVMLAPALFHPQRSAISREYIYRVALFNKNLSMRFSRDCQPRDLLQGLPLTELYRITPVSYLNFDKLTRVLELFKGPHDYRAFSGTVLKGQDTVKSLDIDFSISEPGNSEILTGHSADYSIINFRLKSKSFLHHQVRRIIGAIITYSGYEKVDLVRVQDLLDYPDPLRWQAPFRLAEPWGLYLKSIKFKKSSLDGAIKTLDDSSVVDSSEFIDEYIEDPSDDEEKIEQQAEDIG